MTISFERGICCDLNETISREWLVTNGLGGYAAGTVAGVLTRTQHGLLVAMPPDAAKPQLLLAKIDEEVFFDQRIYYLGTNEYRDGTYNPAGFVHLEAFRLEEGFPIFTYRLGGINGLFLEKRIWMAQGQNTTYIQYRALRTTTTEGYGHRRSGITGALSAFDRSPDNAETVQQEQLSLTLTLLPFAAYRPFDGLQYGSNDRHYQVLMHQTHETKQDDSYTSTVFLPPGMAGCTIQAAGSAIPYHLLAVTHPANQATFIPTGVWYWNFLHRQDLTAEYAATDDLYLPGVIRATLWPDEEAVLTIIVSAEEITAQLLHWKNLSHAYEETIDQQRSSFQSTSRTRKGDEAVQECKPRVLPLTSTSNPIQGGEEYLRLLLQAGNRFLMHAKQTPIIHTPATSKAYAQRLHDHEDRFEVSEHLTPVLLADYYAMGNRTRDALIALPGLLLVTGRYGEAHAVLRRFASYMIGGMLPNRLPSLNQPLADCDYSSVDTSLWYFYALDYYLRATDDYTLLEEVFGHLKECINHYVQGTSYGIHIDPVDGLLFADKSGQALTWMDAYVNGDPVTRRAGKAVEVNALWFHALSLMHEWSQHLSHLGLYGQSPSYYQHLLSQCQRSFRDRFWYAEGHYLFDVIDGPDGNDASLRPNQLFALSLRYPILDLTYQQHVMEKVSQHLLTPYGLRTLAPDDSAYCGQTRTQKRGHAQWGKRSGSPHQGSVWPWLVGPYLNAMLSVWSQPSSEQDQHLVQEYLWRKGLQLLEPLRERFTQGLLGMCEGVLDGDSPHQPQGDSVASALSIGELLRSYHMLTQVGMTQPEQVLSY